MVFIVQAPVCLDAHRVLAALATCRGLVLCDPGQVTALLWASESSSMNTEFEDLLRDLLLNYLAGLALEHHKCERGGSAGGTGFHSVHGNPFDLSPNLFGSTEQQPACSAVSLKNVGSCSRGDCPLASHCPHPLSPCSGSVLGSGRKTHLVSHPIPPFLRWPLVRPWGDCL